MKNELLELYTTNDPAGTVLENELKSMGNIEDPAGGTTWACAITGALVGVVTSTLCGTTKCTSQCGK